MKEHAIFLEAGFTPKNKDLALKADRIKSNFEEFLKKVINISHNNINQGGFLSQDIFTKYTLIAEQKTSNLSGIAIDTSITEQEMQLMDNKGNKVNASNYLNELNYEALKLIEDIINFKSRLIQQVNNCEIYTFNYPLLLEHILREAKYYKQLTEGFLSGKIVEFSNVNYSRNFWNNIMKEHAKFIRGLLDPTEKELIKMADEFDKAYQALLDGTVSNNSYNLTVQLKDFKEKGTEGIIGCKVKSIIVPLLADHVLREAHHYLKLIKIMASNK